MAIFYVTPGRYSGHDGAWLDKGHLRQLGARQAAPSASGRRSCSSRLAGWGAAADRFVNMLCFSKQHRVPQDFVTVDVLPDRGHMSWSHAIGEDACDLAVDYRQQHTPWARPSQPILRLWLGARGANARGCTRSEWTSASSAVGLPLSTAHRRRC